MTMKLAAREGARVAARRRGEGEIGRAVLVHCTTDGDWEDNGRRSAEARALSEAVGERDSSAE